MEKVWRAACRGCDCGGNNDGDRGLGALEEGEKGWREEAGVGGSSVDIV